MDVGAALGVIVLAGEGAEIDSLRRFAERLVTRPGTRVMIWSERDVEALSFPERSTSEVLPTEIEPQEAQGAVRQHAGKYRALWDWLRRQEAHEMTLSFREIEEILGTTLPPSNRQHLPHWYNYKGSAVARAIIDAGWKASRADLLAERVTFTRLRRRDPA
jgi:hypothetical protein